jgi:HK97 family phage major capsid protein
MPNNNIISRGDAQALMPEEVSNELLRTVVSQSAVLSRFRRIPVGRQQVRLPVLSALPTAYFVAGDTGLKQTTEMAWANKFLNIEEIAVIVPIPDNVIADMEANIWDEAMPLLTQAFGRCLDNAVFFGVGAPASYPTNIAAAAAAAGNIVVEGANDAAAAGGYFNDVDALLAAVEADGYEVNGWVAATSFKSKLRSARNTLGDRLDQNRVNGPLTELDGYPISYPMRGMFPTSSGGARVFGGDFDQFVVGVRQDISMKVSNEAVIQDAAGNIVYNSFQQDLTFLRLTFRVGWQVANTINYDNPDDSTRYPVGALTLA